MLGLGIDGFPGPARALRRTQGSLQPGLEHSGLTAPREIMKYAAPTALRAVRRVKIMNDEEGDASRDGDVDVFEV